MGEFPWRFLALRNEELSQLRFGYFDADNKCDVLMENNNAWMISSGGTGQWHRWGQEYAPLSQVTFGQFDLSPTRSPVAAPRAAPRTHSGARRVGNGRSRC